MSDWTVQISQLYDEASNDDRSLAAISRLRAETRSSQFLAFTRASGLLPHCSARGLPTDGVAHASVVAYDACNRLIRSPPGPGPGPVGGGAGPASRSP